MADDPERDRLLEEATQAVEKTTETLEDVLEIQRKLETRQKSLELAIGQLGLAFSALAGASRFAADQARELRTRFEDEKLRAAFEAQVEGLDENAEASVAATLDPGAGARPDDEGGPAD